MKSLYIKILYLTCWVMCFQSPILGQDLIINSSLSERSRKSSSVDLCLFYKHEKQRFFVNNKNRSLIMEQTEPKVKVRTEFFLASMEQYKDTKFHYQKTDSINVTFPDIEIWNWGKFTQLFDYQSKNIHLDHKKLLTKWFKNTDSIVACKALFLNGDAELDLAILRKVRNWDFTEDSVTHKITEFQTDEILYQLELYVQRANNYYLIHDMGWFDISDLKSLYFADFITKDNKIIYFVQNNKLKNFNNFAQPALCHALKMVYIQLD